MRDEGRPACLFSSLIPHPSSFPKGSPASPRELHRPRLAHHGHLNLAGVVQLLLDGPGDVVADLDGVAVAGLGGVGDDPDLAAGLDGRSEEHTSELQSQSNLVCRLLLEKKKKRFICEEKTRVTAFSY